MVRITVGLSSCSSKKNMQTVFSIRAGIGNEHHLWLTQTKSSLKSYQVWYESRHNKRYLINAFDQKVSALMCLKQYMKYALLKKLFVGACYRCPFVSLSHRRTCPRCGSAEVFVRLRKPEEAYLFTRQQQQSSLDDSEDDLSTFSVFRLFE